MSLKNEVMVVTLNISQWTARKKDTKVSREVEESHGAFDAGNYNKALINRNVVVSKPSTKEEVSMNPLKAIQKVAGSARTYHYFNTLPWSDGGDRILPSKNYFNYIREMNAFKAQFLELVDEFVRQYPSLVEEARHRLGTMFSENDYPAEKFVADKFGFRYSFMPVSDAEDLRVNISTEEVERIRTEIGAEVNSRVQYAVDDMLNRIREAVGHMAETLSTTAKAKDGSDKDKIFRDSLVGNICALIETIPLLNFSNDPHIDEVINMIRPLCVDVVLLRTEPEVRKEVAERAAAVLPLI